MGIRRIIKTRVLPSVWLVIGLVIAVSLAKIAFTGGTDGTNDDGLRPTGRVPEATVRVERADVVNTLNVDGTIELDAARTVNATADGEIVKVHVAANNWVGQGAPLVTIRSTVAAAPNPEAPESSVPAVRYVKVLAPAAGKVGVYGATVGDQVTKGSAVVTVHPETFRAVGSIRPLDRYRLLSPPVAVTVTVDGGPAPFACTGLTVGDAAAPAMSSGEPKQQEGEGDSGGVDSSANVSCRVPDGVTVFDGLTITMAIDIGRAGGVLVVPVTAVRGLLGTGTVWVLGSEGAESERSVELGATDGQVVEVKSGLQEGDQVLRYVPGTEDQNLEPGPGECPPEMGC